jgi:hypothetical protein
MNNLFTLSLEEIFLIQKIQIETNLNTKIKVYLDTNYWNYLADSKDRPEHQYYKLYKALKEKVDS